MGRRGGDRVQGLVGEVHQGARTGQGTVPWERALFVVELALLPLVQLPHGVITQGTPLVLRLVMGAGTRTADALRPCFTVAGESAVSFRAVGCRRAPSAWHVPW